jgi:hypothetical protein
MMVSDQTISRPAPIASAPTPACNVSGDPGKSPASAPAHEVRDPAAKESRA